jgi:transcriptional regulator with XRE-family HTH domain
MTPPIWLDGHGRRRPTQACWTRGREVAPMRLRASDLGRTGWMPPETFLMPDWCGCSTEYLPVLAGGRLVAHGPDLGARSDGDPTAAVGARRPVLGDGHMTSSVASDVGRRIVLVRHRLGLSQTAFARLAGISRNALIVYERSGRVPKSAPLARIAKAGGSSVDWLLNGRLPRARAREDSEWEAALRKRRAIWRDPTRRRLAIVMLTALGQR